MFCDVSVWYVMSVKILNFFVSSQKQQHKGSSTPNLNHTFIIRGSLSWNIAQKRVVSMINNIQYFTVRILSSILKFPRNNSLYIFIICCNDPRSVLQRCNVLFSGISWNVDNPDSNKPFQENPWS